MATEHPIIGPGYFTREDKVLRFTIYQSDERTLQNIDGWALSWMVKQNKTDADGSALVTKTTSGGITITDAANGECTVTLADTDISAIVGGRKYHHELKRMDAGSATVLSYGPFVLEQAVHGS